MLSRHSGCDGGAVYVVLSCAVAVDGALDDVQGERLVLSDEADLDRVDAVRAGVDAILVGAGTVRRDDPRLVVKSERRRRDRRARGVPETPARVVVTRSGELDPGARLFGVGAGQAPLVYAASGVVADVRGRLGERAVVVDAGESGDLGVVLEDLAGRGVRRLMVEGGAEVLRKFMADGLADELQLAVAPFFVGEPGAPRLAGPAGYRMRLTGVEHIGGMAVLRYRLTRRDQAERDRARLAEAIELSRSCPPSSTAYSVGAVIVDQAGRVIATGYSRQGDPRDHAEEAALASLDPADPRLREATLYSSLEPCGIRRSRPRTCAQRIVEAGIPRVVFALREPPLLADGHGAAELAAAGVEVVEIHGLADDVRAVNAHLLG
jgi:5-amino-6-(5-phosphoribosylamino)uracil reductase